MNEYFLAFRIKLTALLVARLMTKMTFEEAAKIIQEADMSLLDEYASDNKDFSEVGRDLVASLYGYDVFVVQDADRMLHIHWAPEVVPQFVANDSLFPAPSLEMLSNTQFPDRVYDRCAEIQERDYMTVYVEPVGMSACAEVPPGEKDSDRIDLLCAICGNVENVSTDDHGDWMPDVYLVDTEIGTVCPGCQAYCEQGADGVAEVKLERVNWSNASKLQLLILDQFRREVKDESDSDTPE